MNVYILNRSLHRDLGYFFVVITIIYGVSGITLNHYDDWNSDYKVSRKTLNLNLPLESKAINESLIKQKLESVGEANGYLMYDFPNASKLKIYFKNGSVLYDLKRQTGELERVSRMPVFYWMNYLHRNPGGLWTIVSDVYAISLITIAITGLFILKGKNGLLGRGKWFVSSSIFTIFVIFILLIFVKG